MRNYRKCCTWGAAAALGAALVLTVLAGWAGAQYAGRPIFEKDSLYQHISVYRSDSVVMLQFGRRSLVYQSQVDLSNPRRHVHEYSALAFCGLLYKPEPKRLLVLGLGGGVIPREMRFYYPEMEVDVAEIDPDIPPVAERFFGFHADDKLRVHVGDGRVFIRRLLAQDPVPQYDLIILDAFNSEYIPFHLMTKEFLEEVKGVLAPDGAVVANVFSDNRLCDSEFLTFLAVFGRCQAYFGEYSTNVMLVAPGPQAPVLTVAEAVRRAGPLQEKRRFSFDLGAIAMRLWPKPQPDARAIVLTDDKAPVNWLREQETEQGAGFRRPAPAAPDASPPGNTSGTR